MSVFQRRFRESTQGVIVDLPEEEQEILAGLLVQLRELFMADRDPMLRRLKPPARPDSEEAEKGYREMVDDQLLQDRLESIEIVEAGIEGTTLSEGDIGAWMHTLNSMRLILGERLSVEGADLGANDVGAGPTGAIYEWTGGLLEQLVAAAAPALPPGDD